MNPLVTFVPFLAQQLSVCIHLAVHRDYEGAIISVQEIAGILKYNATAMDLSATCNFEHTFICIQNIVFAALFENKARPVNMAPVGDAKGAAGRDEVASGVIADDEGSPGSDPA